MQLNINDSFFDGASDTVLQDMRTMIDRVLVARGKGEKPKLATPSYMELADLGSMRLTELIENAQEARRHCDRLADIEVLAVWRHTGEEARPIYPEGLQAALLHFTVETVMGVFEMRALVRGLWGSGMALSDQVEEAFYEVKSFLSDKHFPDPATPFTLQHATDLDNNIIAC